MPESSKTVKKRSGEGVRGLRSQGQQKMRGRELQLEGAEVVLVAVVAVAAVVVPEVAVATHPWTQLQRAPTRSLFV